jgi:secondary thiamine-phosphate synthase enzyme
MQTFTVRTTDRTDLVDITDRVARLVAESGVSHGICLVYVPHTTAAVTINENADPTVRRDIEQELDKIVPWSDGYAHGEGNSAAHIKSSLVGCHELVPVAAGRLTLGTWQGIYFSEFDGPRTRSVIVKVLAG